LSQSELQAILRPTLDQISQTNNRQSRITKSPRGKQGTSEGVKCGQFRLQVKAFACSSLTHNLPSFTNHESRNRISDWFYSWLLHGLAYGSRTAVRPAGKLSV